jgi:hypothetical protein
MGLLVAGVLFAALKSSQAVASTQPRLSIAVPCFPYHGEQVLCVPLDATKPTKVFFVSVDGQEVCEGRRIGQIKQRAAFDDFRAAKFSVSGCRVKEQSQFFAVFAPDLKVVYAPGEGVPSQVRRDADASVSCNGCEDFARVNGVEPKVSAFALGDSAPLLLHYLIPSYASAGRMVGPTLLVYGKRVQRLPGWCNTAPVLIESAGLRFVAYISNGCENGEQVFRAFWIQGPNALTALEDGRFGT